MQMVMWSLVSDMKQTTAKTDSIGSGSNKNE